MPKISIADSVYVCGEDEDFICLSEKAEDRLLWIMTGLMMLSITPFFVLALLM